MCQLRQPNPRYVQQAGRAQRPTNESLYGKSPMELDQQLADYFKRFQETNNTDNDSRLHKIKKENMSTNYTFKIAKVQDLDIQRICNEAPLEKDAIFLTSEHAPGDAIVCVRNSLLKGQDGSMQLVDEPCTERWGFDNVHVGQGTYHHINGWRVGMIYREQIGKFIEDVRKIRERQLAKKTRQKKTLVKVHFV